MSPLEQLANFGYTLIKGVLTKTQCSQMLDSLECHARAQIKNGSVFFHSPNQTILRDVHLVEPSIFIPLLDQPLIDPIVSQVFEDGYILQNMNASRANSGTNSVPHIDSRIAGQGITHTTSLAVAFCITDFTEANGATRVWPFSHLSGKNPKSALFADQELPPPVIATANAGDALICLGQTWHQVGPNVTNTPRWGCFTFFVPWWHKPNWDYRDCGEKIFNQLNPRQKEILGFTTQVPSAGSQRNYTKIPVESLPSNYDLAKEIN